MTNIEFMDNPTDFVNVIENTDMGNPFTNEALNYIKPLYYKDPILCDKTEGQLSDKHINNGVSRLMNYRYIIGIDKDNKNTNYTLSVDAMYIPKGENSYQFVQYKVSDIAALPKELAVKTLQAAKSELEKEISQSKKVDKKSHKANDELER